MIQTRIVSVSSMLLIAVALPIGCASKVTSTDSSGSPATTGTATSMPQTKLPDAASLPKSGKALGDPCVPSDGWQPAPRGPGVTYRVTDSGTTIVEPQPVPPGPQDTDQLPPGVGYCNTAAPAPGWTLTCRRQSDCPPGWACPMPPGEQDYSQLCVKSCASVADCKYRPSQSATGYLAPSTAYCQPPYAGVAPTCLYVFPPSSGPPL
jgi:hypothetical protein